MSEIQISQPHRFMVRIYWEDTDAAGIVYYANYLRFLERARSDLVRQAGIDQVALLDSDGVVFPVRRCEIDYLQPARLDDEVEVRTSIQKLGGASMAMVQDIHRGDQTLVRAKVRLACTGPGGRPRRLPANVRAALSQIVLSEPKPAHKPALNLETRN
ncbi:MAG: tol-pal system-associated acyl-CoA thioesterase [Rhodospirillaceae bacterium]|jgi:acyl-CoA thioester hydrolase|nr:tol-pal system-associated acyl-CoA thioesterase [Rhodospirillaceae bacterium]MBT3494231.1 tol-pal system-associated acyl-CoA thioesterase [Rhodospirillaceae bacterium]MBT3780195.1 tol-pal system-associated acyl-CoA thioesterase [Rhodospirillaceae bacterium]MBT3979228.1 tol-pal system-associated acyl-CoA thioesterase [Rhodospirillaceae bacterium]MBT4169918.1 tol-pal system-associated acyl-CoA thioesterase [Rhodospirillaceae bacterium]